MLEFEARYMKTFDSDGTSPGQATQHLSLDPGETALLLVDVYHGLQGEEDADDVRREAAQRAEPYNFAYAEVMSHLVTGEGMLT